MAMISSIHRLVAAAPSMASAIRSAAEQALIIQLGPQAGMVLIPRAHYDELERALDKATGEYACHLYANANDNG